MKQSSCEPPTEPSKYICFAHAPVLEAKGDAPALHVLLPDASHHLGDVDEGALGARRHHLDDVVLRGEGRQTTSPSMLLQSEIAGNTDASTFDTAALAALNMTGHRRQHL